MSKLLKTPGCFILAFVLTASNVSAQEIPHDDILILRTAEERISYSVGVKLGELIADGKDSLNIDLVVRAIQDLHAGRKLLVEQPDVDQFFTAYQRNVQERHRGSAQSDETEFLEANAKKSGVVKLDSGLQYKVIRAGNGAKPKASDTVKTHYRGTLLDGTEFDSSYSRGEPATFPVSRVIPGWTEALQLMNTGAKWELYIPAMLAYGARGAPPTIPPYSTLVFEIELLEIVTSP